MNDGIRDLILVRLLAAGKGGVSITDVRRTLKPLLESRLDGGDLADVVERTLYELAQEGLVEELKRKVKPLDAGRARAAEYLGIDLPKTTIPWPRLRDEYLIARALGIEPTARNRQRIGQTGGLRSEIIRQGEGLDLQPAPSPSDVKEHLAWKLLAEGAAEDVIDRARAKKFSASSTFAALVYSKLGIKGRPDATTGVAMLAARALSCVKTDAAALRAALVARLLTGAQSDRTAPAPPAAPRDEPLPQFALNVNDAALASETGRFGSDHVFISHVYREYARRNAGSARDIKTFKSLLIEANRQGLLRLARADLAQEMNPKDISESATEYLTATFHFVVTRGDE